MQCSEKVQKPQQLHLRLYRPLQTYYNSQKNTEQVWLARKNYHEKSLQHDTLLKLLYRWDNTQCYLRGTLNVISTCCWWGDGLGLFYSHRIWTPLSRDNHELKVKPSVWRLKLGLIPYRQIYNGVAWKAKNQRVAVAQGPELNWNAVHE